jgi:putative ABC transport system permease protein
MVIHIAGLSVGILSTLMILFYVNFERSYEDMHAQAKNIFRITLDLYNGNEFVLNDSQTYQTLGPEFKDKLPEVRDFVRLFPLDPIEFKSEQSKVISYENKVYFADKSILDIFSFDFIGKDERSKFN